jgi:hypothetical protein
LNEPKKRNQGEIIRQYGSQRAFCEAVKLSYTRFSRILNGRIPPNGRERIELGKLLKRAKVGTDEKFFS